MSHPSTPTSTKKPTYLVCHHGAGASGLSFAALAKEVIQQGDRELGVIAFDARGHGTSASPLLRSRIEEVGKTMSAGKKEDTDLALEMLLADFLGILEHLFPDVRTAPSLLVGTGLRHMTATGGRAANGLATWPFDGSGAGTFCSSTAAEEGIYSPWCDRPGRRGG